MTDDQAAVLSVLTALNKMMRASHFDICTLDAAIKVLRTVPDGRAYDVLRPLHCINWRDMPPELRAAVPGLIERCISVPAYQFQVTPVSKAEQQALYMATAQMLGRPQ